MSKSLSILLPLLIASSLSFLTLALNPTLQGNYFYVTTDNHLSYELYQTQNGTIAHSIEPLDENTFISRYSLLNLETKDALSILSDLVSFCDIPNPIFQSIHYHAQTDTLVYYCAKNMSLLILNQQDHTVQTSISLGAPANLPVAKLSTDGESTVAILLMDTLFTQSPQNSVFLKVNLQTKTISTQILFNKKLTPGEAVVAYAANKNHAYIATNILKSTDLTTTLYSIVFTENNTYQLTPITNFSGSTVPSKIITKLFTLEDFVIVNNGAHIHFFDQQGFVQETKLRIKPLTSQSDGLYQPGVTSQYDGANLYAIKDLLFSPISIYSVVNKTVERKDVNAAILDFQIAFGNPATPGGDLLFIPSDKMSLFSTIYETNTFQAIYQAPPAYSDMMLTETTYTVVRPIYYGLDSTLEAHIFNLKNNTFLMRIAIQAKYYSNKDQNIISFLKPNSTSGCYFAHIDIVSGKTWTTTNFPSGDSICSSYPVYVRITDKGNPEAIFPFADHYVILSETLGRQSFPRSSDTDSINVNFDKDLSLYYLSANQATNQITASLYAFNPLTKNFSRISTNTLDNKPVENQGFFTLNQSTTFALSNSSFTIINKLNSIWSQGNFPNKYNMLTTFTDNLNTQFTIFGYSNSTLTKGDAPRLFSSITNNFIAISGERLNTANARATGTKSFCLIDDLYSTGVVRFYNADESTEKKGISI